MLKNDLSVHVEEEILSIKKWIGTVIGNETVLKLLDDYGVPRDSIILNDFGS